MAASPNSGDLSDTDYSIYVNVATVNGGINNAAAQGFTAIVLDGTVNGNVELSSHGDGLVIVGGSVDGAIRW